MAVQVDMQDGSPGIAVLEHPFGPVAERMHQHAVAAGRNRLAQLVHFAITQFRSHGAFRPGIEDTGTVDTQQHAIAMHLCPSGSHAGKC